MNSLNNLLIATTISLGLGVVLTTPSHAISIARSDFDASATNFDFESSTLGLTTVSDGNLSISNGIVTNQSVFGDISGLSYRNTSTSPISFNFLNPVSAIGFDVTLRFYSNTIINFYDQELKVIEQYSYSSFQDFVSTWTSDGLSFSKFISFNAGSNSIRAVRIFNQFAGSTYIDNIIYQSTQPTAVPEPLSIGTILGGSYLMWMKKKQQAKKVEVG